MLRVTAKWEELCTFLYTATLAKATVQVMGETTRTNLHGQKLQD